MPLRQRGPRIPSLGGVDEGCAGFAVVSDSLWHQMPSGLCLVVPSSAFLPVGLQRPRKESLSQMAPRWRGSPPPAVMTALVRRRHLQPRNQVRFVSSPRADQACVWHWLLSWIYCLDAVFYVFFCIYQGLGMFWVVLFLDGLLTMTGRVCSAKLRVILLSSYNFSTPGFVSVRKLWPFGLAVFGWGWWRCWALLN